MALQAQDLFVVQREEAHLQLSAEKLREYTGVENYLPLSGGELTGTVTLHDPVAVKIGTGVSTITVNDYVLDPETNVVSDYSSLDVLLGPSRDSQVNIKVGSEDIFTVRGDGSVSLSEIDTPLTVPSLTAGDITVNNQLISATDAEMVVQGEGVGELGPIQTPNPGEDMPGDFIHDMVVERNFGKSSKSFVLKINNDIYNIDTASGKLTIKKFKNGLRNTNFNNPDEDLTDDPRFSIEIPTSWYIGSLNIYYGAQGTERYIYIATQTVGREELLIRYDSETVDIDGWEHQWLENPKATTAGGYDYGVNKFIYVGNDDVRTYIKSLDPRTGVYENKVDVASSSSSFGTYCNIYSYSGGKFYLNNGSKLYISEDGFDTYEIKTFSGVGSAYGHTIYQGKHYFITYSKKLFEIGDPEDTTTYKEIPLPSYWSSVSNRFMMYVVGDYIVFYQQNQTPTLFDGEKFFTSEGRETLSGYPQTPFSIDVYNESDEKVRTELLIPAGNKNVALLFDAPKGLIAREPWTPVDYVGNSPDPEPAKLYFNDERIALASEIPDSSLLEHEVSKLDEKVEEVREKLTDFATEINTNIEDTLESANKYTDDEIIKAKEHSEDLFDVIKDVKVDKTGSSMTGNLVWDNSTGVKWTKDSSDMFTISPTGNELEFQSYNSRSTAFYGKDSNGSRRTFMRFVNSDNDGESGVDYKLNLYHLADPGEPNHAANKKYVDGKVSDTQTFVTEELETRDETIGALNLAVNSFEADLNLKAAKTDLDNYLPINIKQFTVDASEDGPASGGNEGKEAKLVFKGDRTGNTDAVVSMKFENASSTQNGYLSFRSEETNDKSKTYFKLNHNLQVNSKLQVNSIDVYSGDYLDILNYSRFKGGFVVKKTGAAIDGNNIFSAKPEAVQTYEDINSSSDQYTVVNKKYVDLKFSEVNVDTSSFATKTDLSGYHAIGDGSFSTSGKITSTGSGLSIKSNIQYGGTTRIGIVSSGGYLGVGTSENNRALSWGNTGITQLMDSTGSNGSTGYYLKKTSSGVQWASVSIPSSVRGGGRRFSFGTDTVSGGFLVNDKWRFNRRDYDGRYLYHDADSFYWSTPLKMTIWDSNGRLVAAAELGKRTYATTTSSIIFRKSDGYLEHLYRGLSTNYIYTVCIEGYW